MSALRSNLTPALSVIIPTFGRTAWLMETLESFSNQSSPLDSFEVIVVDDGSPNAEEKRQTICGRPWPFHLNYVQQENRGPAAARNTGLRKARASFIAFTDDDASVDPDWVHQITQGYSDSSVAGIAGKTVPYRILTLSERYLAHVGHLSRHHYGQDGKLVYLITVNASFVRAALDEVGGFDEAYPFPSGEDMDLGFRMRKLGYRFVFNDQAVVRHRNRETILNLWRTWFIYGRGAFMCATKNPDVASGGVTSAVPFEPAKIVREIGTQCRKLLTNLRNPHLNKLDALMFPFLETTNHMAYQLGRWYQRLFT